MLIQFWERLLGYGTWIETEANFAAAEMRTTRHVDRAGNVSITYDSVDTITWTDQTGTVHDADFAVPDDSPIYQMIAGDKIVIRYDPQNPARYYFRAILTSRVNSATKRALLVLIAAGILGFFIWIRFRLR